MTVFVGNIIEISSTSRHYLQFFFAGAEVAESSSIAQLNMKSIKMREQLSETFLYIPCLILRCYVLLT